jgi:hypothetical protein
MRLSLLGGFVGYAERLHKVCCASFLSQEMIILNDLLRFKCIHTPCIHGLTCYEQFKER